MNQLLVITDVFRAREIVKSNFERQNGKKERRNDHINSDFHGTVDMEICSSNKQFFRAHKKIFLKSIELLFFGRQIIFRMLFASLLPAFGGPSLAQVNPGFKSHYYELPRIQKIGICHGYHKFWQTLFQSFPYDSGFSKDVANKIASAAGESENFRIWSISAMKIIADAIKADGGQTQVKAFAGVCVELGCPVGQNKGR